MNRRLIAGIAVFIFVVGGVAIWFISRDRGGGRDLAKLLADSGFVELRPASNLIRPGAWVVVQNRSPLHIGIICPPQRALALDDEHFERSASTNNSVTRTFSTTFNIAMDALDLGSAQSQANVVEAVELTLKNVKLIELADDQVRANISRRTSECADAIKARYENDRTSLTMIKTVLIADAQYNFTFKDEADVNLKVELIEEFAAKGGLKIDVEQSGASIVLGEDLVWGIKDDQFLAYFGLGLPNTGEPPADSRGILKNIGPIENIYDNEQARREFGHMASYVRHDVPVIRQPTRMSCWATVYAMMESWRTGSTISIEAAVRGLGPAYLGYLERDIGLPGGKELDFVKAADMQALPPANYPLKTFRNLLRERGPVWIITGDGITSHAKLLVGVYGPDEEERRSTYLATTMEFIDPSPGQYVYTTALAFLQEFEREAAHIVWNDLHSIDLRWQVISY